jgi:tetratricopeptide (TPR) repeat protein
VTAFAIGDVAPYLAWHAVRGLPRGRLDAAGQDRLRAALSWNPIHPDFRLRLAEDLASGAEWSAPVYARAREAAEHAVRLQPEDSSYRIGIARVEALGCTALFRDEATRERAAARYDEAAESSRHDPFPLIEKGEFLLRAGDPAGARRAAEQALRIEPEAALPRLLLAESILAEGAPGSRERAERILEEAEAKARRWAAWPKESPYEAHLLTLDPARVRSVRQALGGR